MSNAWSSLTQRLEELQHLGGILGLLEWDQQTMMPSGSASFVALNWPHFPRSIMKLTDPRLAIG